MIEELIGVLGLILSLLPLVVLPLKVKTGTARYILLYIFLVLYYLSYLLYYFTLNEIYVLLLYIFETLFFLNMYRSYLAKELFLALPLICYINDLALIFSFYFATFNLAELLKNKINKRNVSIMAVLSLFFFDIGIIAQLLWIFSTQDYFSKIANIIFLIGTIFFIAPAFKVVRKG
ncbi:MAG: hypothetical protein ACP5JU_03705 [Minisyncoccia bacterium]|jgi:hypothetical protein